MIVFVTGASAGIGAAIARRFSRQGASLVLAARRVDRLEALARELSCPCHVAAMDVRDRASVESVVASLPEAFRAVDVLVNNAGLAIGVERFQDADPSAVDLTVDTNVKGVLHVTQALLPGMIERGSGHVIMLGSVAATWPYVGGNVYGATKAFVLQLAQMLRADLHGTGVRVTDIEPGMVSETEFTLVRMHGDEARAKAVYEGMKALSPDDIAESVAWCAGLPPHVNVNRLELMATSQSFAGFAIDRKELGQLGSTETMRR